MKHVLYILCGLSVVACNKYGGMTKVPANATLASEEFYIDVYEGHIKAKPKNADGTEAKNSKGESYPDEAASAVNKEIKVSINFDAAKEACEKAGKRICQYKEWVAACKGPNNRKYGLQDSPTTPLDLKALCDIARTENNTPGSLPSTAGKFPQCATDGLDIHDMIGNATEWTERDGVPVAAGVAFYQTVEDSHCDATLVPEGQMTMPSSEQTSDLGFRCCKDSDKQ